jgi:alpha-galactosidase
MKRDYRNPSATETYLAWRTDPKAIPFSFVYNGKEYRGFSSEHFTLRSEKTDRAEDKESTSLIFSFAEKLSVTLLLTHYFSHGATEWTVWFENVSSENSDILENPKTEIVFEGKTPVLKGILGDRGNLYRPYCKALSEAPAEFTSDSGRATHGNFPYFNLEYGNGGAMLAIGWAGTWKASFVSEGEKTVYTASAVNGLKTYLKPGERIRTALFVLAPYTVRNEFYATNYWRDWFVTHNLPKANAAGDALEPFSTCNLASDTGLPNSDGSISERYYTWKPTMEKMFAEDVKVDFRWFDAGWYVRPDGGSDEVRWWSTVGTWELDPVKWPAGTFRESTDYAREHGMKTLVWFEPERVTDPENLAKNFGYNTDWAIRVKGGTTISNNIGDPDCFRWTVDRICKMLRDNRVEMYREDNNCDAAALWKYLDRREGESRLGITECKLIDAHYRMWDEIIACTLSYGGCGFVDSCASGGGRNDLESMRRGVPILRSDNDRTTASLRLSMTSSFNQWIPFCGANTKEKKEQLSLTGTSDVYVWRASYLPALNVDSQFTQDPDQDFGVLRFGLREWAEVKPYLLKEFYVLTPWHSEQERDGFTAYCFFDPETEKGVLFAFRGEDCAEDQVSLSLPFAEGNEYALTDKDGGEAVTVKEDFTLHFENPREAKLLWIKRG